MHTEAVTDRSAWTGADLSADHSWDLDLTPAQREELVDALALVEAQGLDLSEIDAATFPLPSFGPTAERMLAELRDGRGFCVLRNFPIDGHDRAAIEKMYWGLCAHLGTGITQNGDASLIHYVTDGALRPNQGTRGVGNPQPSGLHVDLTDCVSLLCVRQAPDDPSSWVGSASQLYNEVLAQRPDDLPRLYEGFRWGRMGEHRADESPSTDYRVPLFSERDGRIACRYNRAWIAMGARAVDERLTDDEKALFDFLDERAHANRFEFPFRTGDIQFVNNYAVLHGRAGHEPIEHEDRKRLLMRIWFDVADPPPLADEAVVRYGIVRHGNLGWTAAQLRAGIDGRSHPRDADGRPLVDATR